MDKKILELTKENNLTELTKLLAEISTKEVKALIDGRAVKGRGDPVAFIRAIFYGSPSTTNAGVQMRLLVFKHCIELLHASELASKISSEMIGVLMVETDAFPASCLAELADVYVDAIKNGVGSSGKSLELFPKILSALAAQTLVAVGNLEMSGTDFKSHILNNLCSGRWDSRSVIHLAAMFRDVPMTTDELKFVLDKMLRMFGDLDLEELPPLVYQMLLLSTKGHKKLVLEGLTTFFVQQDKLFKENQDKNKEVELSESMDVDDKLPHVEGTIILHVTFAVKQDQELGREFLKYLKAMQQSNAASVLAPFNVALALSIAQIHRFEDQILDLLKSTVLRCYKDAERQQISGWVREMVPDSCDVAHLLLHTVKNSVYGWDHVCQGLVQLGFALMDAFGPKSSFGKVTAEPLPTCHQTPTQRSCQLGASVLQEIFKVQEMVRSEILEQIFNRIVIKATSPVSHYIDLLASTVRSAPQILLDSLAKVREALDYLSYLPPPTADGLLQAIQPLMKLSMGLKDSLMLTLRKSVFSRHLESRKIAVGGFLMLLCKFRVLGGLPMSQASQSFSSTPLNTVEVHIPHNASLNEAVCLEILGNLRRCLTQQADVRLTLYEGLYDVMSQNSQLRIPIINLLLSQFCRYYEREPDVQPPVKLDPCILSQGDQIFMSEPLSHLLCCLIQCFLKSHGQQTDQSDAEDGSDDDNLSEVEEILESLTRRTIKCELEDFELDKSADFSTATSVGRKNNIFAILVMGSYEGLMEYNFLSSKYEPSTMQNVLHLFAAYQKVTEIVKDKPPPGGGKRGRPGAGATSSKLVSRSMLSLHMVSQIMRALFCDSMPSHQEAVAILRETSDLSRYILGVALQKLQQINDKGTCDGAEGRNKDKLFKYSTDIAKILLQHYTTDLQAPDETRKDRSKIATLCLDGLSTAIHIVCHRFDDRLPEFLRELDVAGGETLTDEDQVHKHIKQFQRLALSVLTSTEDDRSLKEMVPLLNAISWLTKYLTPGGAQFSQVQTWILKVATEQNIDDSGVTKAVMSLLFSLTTKQQNLVSLLRDISQDIHRHLGDIDQEVELEGESNFAAVTERTAAPTILLLVLGQADRDLDDTDWMINRMKAQHSLPTTTTGDDTVGPTQREQVEKSICARLGHMINVLHELVQSAVPVGQCVDTVVKTVTKLYSTLTLLVKYYISVYTKGVGHLTARFEKLVSHSGTNLTQHVYAMITYIQACQSEHLQQTTEKSKKKDQKISSAVAAASKARVLKETRNIPNLIFAIEQYEKFLIQLTKKSKVNLMEHMKLSTSRDFRINVAQLSAALEQQQSSSDSESEGSNDEDNDRNDEDHGTTKTVAVENNSDEEGQENREPTNKKAKSNKEAAAPATSVAKKGKLSKGKGRGKSSAS